MGDSNRPIFNNQSGFTARQPNDGTVPISGGPSNMTRSSDYNDNNTSFSQGANINTKEDDKNLSLLDPFFNLISNLYMSGIRDYGCENSNHRRGWIFNNIVPEFAPCGCYVESLWPELFGVLVAGPAAAVKTIFYKSSKQLTAVIVKKLRRKLLVELSLRLTNITTKLSYKRGAFRIAYLALKKLGVDPLAIKQGIFAKLPPVPAGFKRLYRAQGPTSLSSLAIIDDPRGKGYWFTDNLQYAMSYISDDFTPPERISSFKGKYPNGHLVYVDVPVGTQNVFSRGRTGDIGFKLEKNIPCKDIETGEIITASQSRYGDWKPQPNLPKGKKVALRRKNIDGDIEWVYDYPATNDSDTLLNPGIMVGDDTAAGLEYFLDANSANMATKIAAVNNIFDIQEFMDILIRLDSSVAIKLDGDEIWTPLTVFNNAAEWKKAVQNNIDRGLANGDSMDFIARANAPIVAAEDIIGNRKLFDQKMQQWADIFTAWENLAQDHIDNMPVEISNFMTEIKNLFVPELTSSGYRTIFEWGIGMFIFIETILAVISVVEIKKCHPDFLNTTSLPGTTDIDIEIISSKYQLNKRQRWQLYDQFNKFPVHATLNPETCACSECPPNRTLCDKSSVWNPANPLSPWDDRWNTCFASCCGGRELAPITITKDCGCECPEGQEFLPCERSTCKSRSSEISYILSWIYQRPIFPDPYNTLFNGICVISNPNPDKLEWDTKECAWVCRESRLVMKSKLPNNYRLPAYMPYGVYVGGYATEVLEKLPPCAENKTRRPPNCECEDIIPTPTPTSTTTPTVTPTISLTPSSFTFEQLVLIKACGFGDQLIDSTYSYWGTDDYNRPIWQNPNSYELKFDITKNNFVIGIIGNNSYLYYLDGAISPIGSSWKNTENTSIDASTTDVTMDFDPFSPCSYPTPTTTPTLTHTPTPSHI